jgi:hypothetical protein
LKEKEEFLQANLVQPTAVAQEITDGEILTALGEIPSEFRSVVLLVDVEEFAYKEVAEILSIPIGTVISRLSRGAADFGANIWPSWHARTVLEKRRGRITPCDSYNIWRPGVPEVSAKLDSYIDNELLTESYLEIMEHFGCCAPCTQRRKSAGMCANVYKTRCAI